jgi:tetratricopeptide (TPR) repeat protein
MPILRAMRRTPRTPSFFSPVLALLLACACLAGCTPTDPLAEVRRLQDAGDFAGSLEPLREILKERPDDAEVHYLYGRALVMNSQPSLAEWSLEEAMKDPEWLVPAGMLLATGQLRGGNLDLAEQTATRILEVEPDNVEALLLRANAYAHSNRDEEKALADADRLEELDPGSVEVMEPRILALIDLERYDEASEAIEEMGRRIEDSGADDGMRGWHCATAALFSFERGNVKDAEERWQDCTERFPTHGNVIQNAVTFYDDRHEYDRSLEVLRRAHEEAPESRDYRLNLTDRLRAMGKVDEAREILEAATEDPPPYLAPVVWVDLSQFHYALGEYQEAARAADQALVAARALGGEPNPHILFHYADTQIAAGHLDEAEQAAKEMTVEAHRELVLARIAQERGQLEEALAHFGEAARLWPENPYGRYYAALASERLGRFDDAIASYRYAIRLGNDATDAKVRLARILDAEGHTREALETLYHQALGEARPSLDLEAEILAIELRSEQGIKEATRQQLVRIEQVAPLQLGRAIAAAAEGLHRGRGPEPAVQFVRKLQKDGLDLSDPTRADALRVLVRFADEAGELGSVREDVEAAVRAHPDASVFQEIRGRWLERSGKPDEAARAYARATELDAGNARAWVGRGRLAAASDPEAALGYFDRAREADPKAVEPLREAARVLVAAGRPREAEARLDQLLTRRAYDGDAAAMLVGLRLDRQETGDETLELANRAVRFGGGPEALDLLSRVHTARGETDLAVQAAGRAQDLRDRLAGG